MSRERLILSAILGTGIVALAVDRFVLSGDITGPTVAVAFQATYAVSSSPATTVEEQGKQASLGARLHQLKQSENLDLSELPDIFSAEHRQGDIQREAAPDTILVAERKFLREHRLVGVIASRTGGDLDDFAGEAAFIEVTTASQPKPFVRRVTVGDRLDGFSVVEMGLRGSEGLQSPYVLLAQNGRTIRLSASNGQ
ncbi:MAG: hypothetical protein IH985_06675 [Planctomycetes bacterium]|nr:hypothetical protein [Planctomycetota bacterium]